MIQYTNNQVPNKIIFWIRNTYTVFKLCRAFFKLKRTVHIFLILKTELKRNFKSYWFTKQQYFSSETMSAIDLTVTLSTNDKFSNQFKYGTFN